MLKLANLARIKISPTEAETLSREFDAILGYVSEVKGAATKDGGQEPSNFATRNVMREDGEGHKSGLYTETLLAAAPGRSENYFKVKKIL